MSISLAIVDSGGANIASVRFALERLGIASELTADPTVIRNAERVILPGVGAAQEGMKKLRAKNLIECVRSLTQPVIGFCLGEQLLFDSSEEGDTPSLGIIPGRVARIPDGVGITVPHMGWNTLEVLRDTPLLKGIAKDARFYFVHSFAGPVNEFTLATATHGVPFAAVVQRKNFYGVQFHPERSGTAGAQLLKNFLEISV
ncbi:imidazole glycerol phosphate synthase subunit HisH [Oleiharenicola lentus]|uniref:imidazole glycerol phosphate synthase subunit HisH n=1 Tax=Oleiharenicola lentus TaxID=2508720 RepID=UPI003F66240A